MVYKTVVRPALDYCCIDYHPMLTEEQDQLIYFGRRMNGKPGHHLGERNKEYRDGQNKAGQEDFFGDVIC